MNNWLAIDKKNIWHPFTPLTDERDPIFVQSAAGVYLHTQDGRKIIDAISSWWVNIHGHSHPAIAKAVAEQASTLEHVIFAGFTHEPAITLSKNLFSILPDHFAKIFFSDNGSTSVEVALKMAMQYWHNQTIKKPKVVALEGAYHGDTFGAMSVASRNMFSAPFDSYLFDVSFLDFPTNENEEAVVSQFTAWVEKEDVGVFIFEPLVQGASGMRMYSSEILDKLIDIAHQHDVVCIADEVFTGFGRTGKLFATDYLTHKPDIMCISKGLTGGTLPMGITVASQRIVDAFETPDFNKTFFHGHSYTANPLACAVANASFKLLMDPTCQANIKRIEARHQQFKKELQNHPRIKDTRQRGTILAIELDYGETHYANEARKKIYDYFLQRNILLRPLGNVIYILPPYVTTDTELGIVYDAIKEFLYEEMR